MGNEETYGVPEGGEQEGGTSPASQEKVSVQEDSQPERQEPTTNEKPITQKDLEVFEQRILNEATKRAQSMTDKMGSRLDKEIQTALDEAKDIIETGKKAGVNYTPEQEQKIRDQRINEAYSKLNQPNQQSSPDPSEQSATQQNQETGNQQGINSYIGQEVNRIMSETGVYISADEANKLILGEDLENKLTPYQYIQAFESLAQQRQTNNRQPQGANSKIPSMVTGGKSPTSQSALRQSFEKEMAQIKAGKHPTIRRGNIDGIQRLEIAYRDKGLDI
jgi:hypothetical protein